MNRKAIVTIEGVSILCHNESDAATMLGMIDQVVVSSGYGKDQKWEIKPDAEISMNAIQERHVLRLDDPDRAEELLERIREEKDKKNSELSKAREELAKEKKFWEVKKRANSLGWSDEELREKLKSWYTWKEFKIEKKGVK